MKEFSNFYRGKVAVWLLAFWACSFASVEAQKLTADETSACEGYSVMLTADGFPSGEKAANLLESTDGGSSWKEVQTSADPTGSFTFVIDMGSRSVQYKVRGQNSKKETNVVSVALTTNCPQTCHTTSTGEYFLGTDFDPISGKRPDEIDWGKVPPTNLSSYFAENNINFKGNCGNGKVVENWKFSDNKTQPSGDRGADGSGSNFYYAFSNCQQPFHLSFNGNTYRNKYFRFRMKMYVDLTNCNREDLKQARMNFRTGFGNDSYNAVEIDIYDDAQNRLLKDLAFDGKGQLPDNIVGGVFASNSSVRYFRLEVTMYGQFVGNQPEFDVIPEFQQWGSCPKIAVDYISADVENVCLDHGSVCVNKSTTINAAGFPRGATYKWEMQDPKTKQWSVVTIDGFRMEGKDYQTINLLVDFLGTRNFRVTGTSSLMGQQAKTTVEFKVSGKNCDPVQPTEIEGDDYFCVPGSQGYSVSPVDANQNVTYAWDLTDPNGKTFFTDKFKYEELGEMSKDARGSNVTLTLNRDIPDGIYVLRVQPVIKILYSDGTSGYEKAGKAITKEVKIFKTADPKISLNCTDCDGLSEINKELCPTDKQQTVTVTTKIDPNSPYYGKYVYEWAGAVSTTPAGPNATVDFITPAVCAGTQKSHKVGVKVSVEVDGVLRCPTSDANSYKIKDVEKPKIQCSTPTRTEELSETECKKSIAFSFPSFTSGCTTSPSIKVELSFTPNDGSATITKTITKEHIAQADIASFLNQSANKVSLPAGKGTIKYTVTDDCDYSDVCTQTIEVKDVTPPNVDCSKIKAYTVNLSDLNATNCQAITGKSTKLPTIVAPELEDKNDPCGKTKITGVYEGRSTAQSKDDEPDYETEADRLAGYSKDFDLNDDPYSMGYTFILWSFTDASGNTSYCTQKITVIDDLKPNVVCPDYTEVTDIDNMPGECGLSVKGILSWMAAHNYKEPSAKDVCSGKNANLKAQLLYGEVGGELEVIPASDYDKIIFFVGKSYEMVWRFYKSGKNDYVDKTVYSDCSITFEVKDTEAPTFDCSSLDIVRVTANRYKPKDKAYEYLEYASMNDVKKGQTTYEGTLKTAFSEGMIKMLTADMAQDNCSDALTVTAVLEGPDDKGKNRTLTIKKTADLEKALFGIGVTTITFTFKDASGNETTCTQYIMVTSGTTPIPNCTQDEVTVYADEDCKATYQLKTAEVPTASFPVDMEGFYFNFRYASIANLHFGAANGPSGQNELCLDMAEFFPDNLEALNGKYPYKSYTKTTNPGPTPGFPGMGAPGAGTIEVIDLNSETICDWTSNLDAHREDNKWKNFLTPSGMGGISGGDENILEPANTYTTIEHYTGYPYKIEVMNSDSVVVKTVLNTYANGDVVPTRRIVPRRFGSDGNKVEGDTACVNISITCGEKPVKVLNNFKASDLKFTGLTKGTYTMTFYFEDTKNGLQTATCTRIINVVDNIPPTVTCGDWELTKNLVANGDCVVPASDVEEIKMPTVDDLFAEDNCTPTENLTIAVSRDHEESESFSAGSSALTDPLQMGTTHIYYTVIDESGNSATCTQTFIVEDKTGPEFECSKLATITAYAGDACKALYKNIKGIRIPYAKQDHCSPSLSATTKGIEGVPTRSDGKALKDAYEMVNSPITITWTFSDSLGNTTSCPQIVNVVDTVAPKFDCSKIEDKEYYAEYDECQVLKEDVIAILGSYTATDNCSGDVPGVPFLRNDEGEDVALPDKFDTSKEYLIIWKFTDESGNVSACQQNLSIKDTVAPKLGNVCPDDVVVDATEETGCSVPFDHLNLPAPESISITDPCDGEIIPELEIRITLPKGKIEVVYGLEEAQAASYPVGTHTALWIYKDKAIPANSDTCIQMITVLDKIKPILADCDDAYNKRYSFTVDADNCEYDPVKVNAMLVHPKAYDQCDSELSGDIDDQGNPLLSIDPVIERYSVDTTTNPYSYTLYADGINKQWDEDNFVKGAHMLRWIFKDKSGNTETCEKFIYIIDATGPYFDCSKINPDTLRPEAKPGFCEVEFADLKRDVLDTLSYKAYDACSLDSIPGVLTLNGTMELPKEYTMKVGVTYKLLWLFQDEDGNKTTCPQWILPSHRNPVDFDCSTLKPIAFEAQEGECDAPTDSVLKYISTPTAIDACSDYEIVAKPFFVSGTDTTMIDLETQKFATGDTTIHWMFLSIWNIHDTLWCKQPVSVLGKKNFDLVCEEIAPMVMDTIENCGPSESAMLKVTTPWTPDPCASSESPYYKRYGEGTRLDSTAANPVKMTDPYPLGDSRIQWVFTDFTGNVSDTCIQTVNVKTRSEIVVDCETLLKDTIKSSYEVPDGTCTVAASEILPDPSVLEVPEAKHPCLDTVKIDISVRRAGGKSWDDDYIVGVNWIEWVFKDPTHTTVVDEVICKQPIQVGKDNATLFDCKNIKPIHVELDPEGCTVDTLHLHLKDSIPLAYDACGDYAGQLIEPILYRTSKADVKAPFGVGYDTIVWVYNYRSIEDSVVCKQPVHVLDSKEPIFDCSLLKDTTMASEPEKCYLPGKDIKVMLNELKEAYFATDACVDTIKIKGEYNADEIPDVLKVGDTITIHWTFQNGDYNLAKKECDQRVTVIGDMAPIFDCDSLPLDTFETYECDTLLTSDAIKTPYATDACTGDSVEGVGVRLDGGELYGKYPAGVVTQIRWTFKSKFSTKDTSCVQDIVVLTTKEPIFDCSTLDTIRVASNPGECFADSSVVMKQLTDHYAKDACTGKEIKGVPSYNDGPLPERYVVGDTTLIKWTFIDSSLTVTPKICYQAVLVTGDQKPLFDCDTLKSKPIEIENGCDTTLSEQTIRTPFALDACTHDSVPGVGKRLDGGELYGVYPVGTTTIQWVFISPFSSATDTCNQDITVLTKEEIIFDCEALAYDTIKVNVATGECQAEATLPTKVAQHPCPDQSGVKEIKGIPSYNGETLTANADSSEWKITLPTGVWNVTWTFSDHSYTLVDSIKSCDQPVRIGDVNQMPVNCENYPDTLIKLPPTDCEITWSEIGFKQPEVVDLCSNKTIEPELTRWSGRTMEETFTVGLDTIYWAYSFSGQNVVCKQAIHVLDSMAPIFDCSTLEDISLYAKEGTCEVSSEELVEALGSHVAKDSCTGAEIPGVAYVNDVTVDKVTAKVGDTVKVHWVFIDTMLNAVAKECDQYVYVYGQNRPIFDCESLADTILYLGLDECELDGAKLSLNIPVAKDSCTGTPVPGVPSRQDGEAMAAVYKKGVTVVDWLFQSPFSNATRTCSQNVVVKDILPPTIDCTVLKDTVKVRITSESISENSVTAEEAAAAGLVAPSVEDKCDGTIVAVGHRDDGMSMDDPYILKTKTKVTWVYTDASGNSDSCSQIVVVEDWVVDDLNCPSDLTQGIQCVENLPAAYATYEEFKLGGGSFSNESKMVEGSFKVLEDEIPTDQHCDFNVVRTYQVTDVRKNEIQCKQKIHVVDNVAPTLSDKPADMKLSCTDEIPVALTITAEDDCLPTAVDVKFSESSTRGTDPNSCDYYNYTITRVWTATDRCDNESLYRQYLVVVDTLAPEFTFPKDWKDTVLSIYNKGCTFGVPDFTVEVRSIVSDNCTDITNITVTQEPAAGSLIKSSTSVKVTVADMCGNTASLYKYVLVPGAGTIVDLTAFDTALCADDNKPLTLWSQEVRLAVGSILVEDWDGSYTSIPTAFVYDCYLDSISPNSLVYSNNPNTYLNRYTSAALGSAAKADSLKNARINLRKQTQSGHYYFVAMDTLTLCSDTANSYLEIRERPRITMNSGKLNVCEYNGVDSVTLNSFVRCVDDKGGVITEEGWLLGNSVYKYHDSIYIQQDSASFIYYAENECGRSTSIDTYYDFCIGDSIPRTHKDTMKLLGADSIYYELFKHDDYKVRDSILVDVYDRLRSDEIFVTVNEKEQSTVWVGDEVKLTLHSNYGRLLCQWYAVRGKFDRRFYFGEGNEEFKFNDYDDAEDNMVYESYIHDGKHSITRTPRDTTSYYVVLSNEVCPSIAGNVATVNVNGKLPTAFTPYTVDGMNDVFMQSYPVKIFNRYGQLIYEGHDGWRGTTDGGLADPGVYFYECAMRDGTVMKGSIEVVLLK
ncbi:MAG: gliding motility-associated C-terminal domain-containing protein [Paludibacteraceae bacterium]|nr:gliding motility-associated C-terminal domain-containing protein [Paludibacteraceae bacterium]